jgi:hypothetical protein
VCVWCECVCECVRGVNVSCMVCECVCAWCANVSLSVCGDR